MNCRDVRNNLLLAQSGELPARRRAALDRHLAACETCRAYQSVLDGVVSAAKSALLDRDVSPFTLHRIQQEARRHAPLSTSARRRKPLIQPRFLEMWRPAAFSAVAALLMLAVSLLLVRQLSVPPVTLVREALTSPPVTPAPGAWTTDVDAELDELWLLLADAGAGLAPAPNNDESLDSLAVDLMELEGWSI
jgi:anti-sigma factor RsiW